MAPSPKIRFKIYFPGGDLTLYKKTMDVEADGDAPFRDFLLSQVMNLIPAHATNIKLFAPKKNNNDAPDFRLVKGLDKTTTVKNMVKPEWRGEVWKVEGCNFRRAEDTGQSDYNINETSTPNWPVGFPFTVKIAKTAKSGAFSLSIGEFGKVLTLAQKDGSVLVEKADGTRGRVHPRNINIGVVRKYGELRTSASLAAELEKPTAKAVEGTTQTYRAIKALVDEMATKSDLLELSPDFMDTNAKRIRLASDIEEGIKKVNNGKLHAQLQKSNFTRRDIINNAERTDHRHKKKSVIYWRDYEDFAIDGKAKPEIWPTFNLGSSSDGAKRNDDHNQGILKVNSKSIQHYKMGKDAKRRGGYVVCYLPTSDKDTLLLWENILILLFESQRPSVLSLENEHAHPSAVPSHNPGQARDESMVWMMKHAIMLKALADAAKAVSRWPGATSRDEFHAIGNNWNSPIFESGAGSDRTAFARHVLSNGTICYTRGAVKLVDDNEGTGGPYVMRLTHGKETWSYHLPQAVMNALAYRSSSNRSRQPEPGDVVKLTFELAPEGRTHPQRMFKLPKEFAWGDRNRLSRFAIRTEWKTPDGRWRMAYDQRRTWDADHLDDTNVFSIRSWAQVRALVNFFLQDEFSDAPKWQPSYGKARIYQCELRLLEPTLVIRNIAPGSQTIKYPPCRTRDYFVQKLKSLGAENVDASEKEFGPRYDDQGRLLKYIFTSMDDANWNAIQPSRKEDKRSWVSSKTQGKKYPFDFDGNPGRWVLAPTNTDPAETKLSCSPIPDGPRIGGVKRSRCGECDRCWVAKWPNGSNSTPHPGSNHKELLPSRFGAPNPGQRYLGPYCHDGKTKGLGKLAEYKDTCRHCIKYGNVCSFTPSDLLEANHPLMQYLRDTGAEDMRCAFDTYDIVGQWVPDPLLKAFSISLRG